MPTLCVFVDLNNINLLLYKSKDEFWFDTFPYVYSSAIFSASFTQEAFYLNLFNTICTDHGVKLSDCELAITGFLEPPKFTDDFRKQANITHMPSFHDVLSKVTGHYPIFITNQSICTADLCISNSAVRSLGTPELLIDREEENYYANLELYPQVVPSEIAVQIDIDTNLVNMLQKATTSAEQTRHHKPSSKSKAKKSIQGVPSLVFSGSRFSQNGLFRELDYLLMLCFVNKHGIFDVKKDTHSKLLLSELLKITNLAEQMTPEVKSNATVISSSTPIEGTIQTDLGTSQLIHIEKNKLMVIPTTKDELIKLNLKSQDIGVVEQTVSGGSLGLIFDTRESKTIRSQDIKVFSPSIKSFKAGAVKSSASLVSEGTK